MKYYVKNISRKHAFILKQTVASGERVDLEKLFKDFCKPKYNSKKEVVASPEFNENQFNDFLKWVNGLASDRGVWEVMFNGKYVPADSVNIDPVIKRTPTRRSRKTKLEVLKIEHLAPTDIAWLPFDDLTKKMITECTDLKKMKASFSLVRNLAGQERLRKLIETQIHILESERSTF
jgi:hypothetical protein